MVGNSFLVLLLAVAAAHGTFSPHNLCTNAHLKQVRKHVKDIRCKPLPSIVELPRSAELHKENMSPSHVKVNRCSGAPQGLLDCMPGNTKMMQVQVVLHGRVFEKCGLLEVEEHVTCKYDCAVRKENCTESQVYLEDECRCNCIDSDKQAMCEAQTDRRWNPHTCQCDCTNTSKECTTGLLWVPSICRCRQVMMEEDDVMM